MAASIYHYSDHRLPRVLFLSTKKDIHQHPFVRWWTTQSSMEIIPRFTTSPHHVHLLCDNDRPGRFSLSLDSSDPSTVVVWMTEMPMSVSVLFPSTSTSSIIKSPFQEWIQFQFHILIHHHHLRTPLLLQLLLLLLMITGHCRSRNIYVNSCSSSGWVGTIINSRRRSKVQS